MPSATAITRSLRLFSLAAFLVFFAADAHGQNLLTNPGCEAGGDPPTGWAEDDGQDDWRCVDSSAIPGIDPADGTLYFLQNATNPGDQFNSLRQLIDVTGMSAAIDVGDRAVDFSGKYRDDTGNSVDVLRYFVNFYDASVASINGGASDWTSGAITGNTTFNYVTYFGNNIPVPVGTRYIEVEFECKDNDASSFCDYTFDTFFIELVTALPVELTRFEAASDGGTAVLQWSTASEAGNLGYEVQHELRDGEWQTIGFVEPTGPAIGEARYQYRTELLTSGAHRFRLKQMDHNGSFSFSPIVEVTIESTDLAIFGKAYPNPFTQTTRLSLTLAADEHVRIGVFNIIGQEVQRVFDGPVEANGQREFTIDGSSLPAGLYLVRMDGDSFSRTQSIVLQQ